ncbi:hypothetical protein CLIB1423_15S02916 [[Candida] railenensis]|uniref:Uncharacterized protein n=1 Tax=[Candida] railenensis TaxID=45579 RepID=A0A9P0QSU4_9ASCO|nr:hypothetical protein CLIB1423_15S02916 [[Candida] railenensis]
MSQNMLLRKVPVRPRSSTVGAITNNYIQNKRHAYSSNTSSSTSNTASSSTKIELIYPWLDLQLRPSKVHKWKATSSAFTTSNLEGLKTALVALSKTVADSAEEKYLDDEHFYYVDIDVPEAGYEGIEVDKELYEYWQSL